MCPQSSPRPFDVACLVPATSRQARSHHGCPVGRCSTTATTVGAARHYERVAQYVPNRKEIDQEEARLTDPLWMEGRPLIFGFVLRLRNARTVEDFWSLQLDLIAQVRARQIVIGELRRDIDRWRAQRSEMAAQQPRPEEEIRALQRRITRAQHQERVQDGLRHLLLSIGDGVAWKCFGYDRAAITILGHGQRVAWLSDGSGWQAEVEALEHERAAGRFALLNDLTTCMRNGDVTVFMPEGATIHEVKAGAAPAKDAPQLVRIRQLVSFAVTGRSEIEGHEGGYVRCPVRYRTHLAQLPPLLRRAQKTGSAGAKVSPCQFVVAHDMRFFAKADDLPKLATIPEACVAAGWSEDDVILHMATTVRRMRDRHHSFATLAPLSIFPLPPDLVTDLMHGWLNFTAVLNVSVLAQSLADAGTLAEAVGLPESENVFLRILHQTAPSTAVAAQVAPHDREMMLMELMTPATLLAGIQRTMVPHAAATTSDEQQRQMVFWADEHLTWRRVFG